MRIILVKILGHVIGVQIVLFKNRKGIFILIINIVKFLVVVKGIFIGELVVFSIGGEVVRIVFVSCSVRFSTSGVIFGLARCRPFIKTLIILTKIHVIVK